MQKLKSQGCNGARPCSIQGIDKGPCPTRQFIDLGSEMRIVWNVALIVFPLC